MFPLYTPCMLVSSITSGMFQRFPPVQLEVTESSTSHHGVSGSPFSSSITSPVWKQSGVFPEGIGVPW